MDEALLERLVGALRPTRRRRPGVELLAVLALCAIELAVLLGYGFARPDLPMAESLASFWWKLGSLGAIAIAGGFTSILSFSPTSSPRRGLRWLLALVALCILVGWFIDMPRGGVSRLLARIDWPDGLVCVAKMLVLSLPPLLGLGLLMRRAAPTDPRATAVAVGITAAACGAFLFVAACPHDDPLYVVVWYGAACLLVTTAARLLLPILTRW